MSVCRYELGAGVQPQPPGNFNTEGSMEKDVETTNEVMKRSRKRIVDEGWVKSIDLITVHAINSGENILSKQNRLD